MSFPEQLLANNRHWAAQMTADDPEFFAKLSKQQAPHYLWIGCSDSRVPANQIVGLPPGDLFVHRNVANIVYHTDLNCLSVLQYAVEVLGVRHVMVCGHYGCGGVRAAMRSEELGLIDNWLRAIRDIYRQHRAEIDGLADDERRVDRLCELNVAQQVANVCHTTIIQNAWRQRREVTVHGLIYGIHDGLLRDLDHSVSGIEQIHPIYRVGG